MAIHSYNRRIKMIEPLKSLPGLCYRVANCSVLIQTMYVTGTMKKILLQREKAIASYEQKKKLYHQY